MTNNFWGLKAGFILASGSPQRKALLEQVRLYPDKIISPDVDESALPNELPSQYVKRIAVLKAEAVFKENKGVCVVAADTILTVGRRIIRKAADEEAALKHLQLLSGRKHRVITGLCVISPQGKVITRVSQSVVTMKHLSKEDMALILKSGEYQNVAGYKIEGFISAFIKRINGSYDSIVGLPVYETVQILRGVIGS